jgi:hypothetical protein
MRAVVAPGADHDRRFACGGEDRAVVAAPDRVARRLHVIRVGGAPAEQVGDDQRAVAPALGVAARARARRVELHLVGGAGVEHQEVRHRLRLVPAAPEQIAPAAAAREQGAGFPLHDLTDDVAHRMRIL